MIVGTTIIHDGAGTTPYLSPSFPRGGLAATFAAHVTHEAGGPTLVIQVQHRNVDELAYSVVGTFSNITGPGTSTLDVTDIKEEVRFAFTFSAGSAGDFVHVVIPMPAWRPYA